MTRTRTVAATLVLGLWTGLYVGGAIADSDIQPKFADPDRLIESLLVDDQAKFDEDLAALDPAYSSANIDTVLGDLNAQLLSAQGLLDEVTTTRGELVTALEGVPEEISAGEGIDLVADADLARLKIAELTDLTDPELLVALSSLGLDPAIDRDTLEAWDEALETATADFVAAKTVAETQGAQGAVDALAPQIEAIEAVVGPFYEKEGAVAGLVDSLSPEQVFALNRSLNNALSNGLLELMNEFDLQMLQAVVDGDFNKQQINAYTKAFEEYAKFLDKGMVEKAEAQRDKFLAKVAAMDTLSAGETGAGAKGHDAAVKRNAAKGAARSASQQVATLAAKGAAKGAAKQAAKVAAKGAAQQAARDAAKDAAKGAAKQAAKAAAKQAAKNAAKQAAKTAAKQAAKNAAKNAARG